MKNIKLLLTGFILTIIFTGVAWACTPEQPVESTCEELQNCITPSPEVTLEASPSAEVTTAPQGGIGQGDGLSDHRSDGLCSQPPCVTPGQQQVVIPSFPPDTGRGS